MTQFLIFAIVVVVTLVCMFIVFDRRIDRIEKERDSIDWDQFDND